MNIALKSEKKNEKTISGFRGVIHDSKFKKSADQKEEELEIEYNDSHTIEKLTAAYNEVISTEWYLATNELSALTIHRTLRNAKIGMLVQFATLVLYRGFKFHKIFKIESIRVKCSAMIDALRIHLDNSKPPLGKYRTQQVCVAFPYIIRQIAKWEEMRGTTFFGTRDQALPPEFRFFGSLSIYWYRPGEENSVPQIAGRILNYEKWSTTYIADRRRDPASEPNLQQQGMTIISYSWLGRFLESWHQDTITAWEGGLIKTPALKGNFAEEVKQQLCLAAGMNMWANIAKPPGQEWTREYVASLSAKVVIAPKS